MTSPVAEYRRDAIGFGSRGCVDEAEWHFFSRRGSEGCKIEAVCVDDRGAKLCSVNFELKYLAEETMVCGKLTFTCSFQLRNMRKADRTCAFPHLAQSPRSHLEVHVLS